MTTPTFSLDFTSASLDSRITFTRAGSTATQVNSSGYVESVGANTPRFDYNPLTLVCKGLLIEEQRTNIVQYSEDFTNILWSRTSSNVTGDATTAPNNTTTADKFYEDTSTGGHLIFQALAGLPDNTVYTASCYIEPAGRDWIAIGLINKAGVNNRVWFNVSTGQQGTTNGTVAAFTSQNAGNGWYKLSVSVSTASGAGTVGFRISLGTADNTAAYTGNGVSGVYLWGAQVEDGAFSTSYIPNLTSGSTIRNADIAVMTGTNFSSWWQVVKGGTSAQALPSTVSGISPLIQFDDNTANEIIALRGNTTNPELYIVDGGTPQAQIDAGTIVANTSYSLTGWWQTNDCKARQNSGATVSDYTATIPTVTQARIGSDGTNYLNGTIATINYYDSFFGRPIYTRRKNKVFPSLF